MFVWEEAPQRLHGAQQSYLQQVLRLPRWQEQESLLSPLSLLSLPHSILLPRQAPARQLQLPQISEICASLSLLYFLPSLQLYPLPQPVFAHPYFALHQG
jgi:hypothetical protein